MWLIALSPIIGLAVETLAHMLFVSLIRRVLTALGLGVLLGAAALAYLISVGAQAEQPNPIDLGFYIAAATLSFLALTFCFWTVINLNSTSIRIRVLREIWAAPGRRLPVSSLANNYNADVIFDARIERLEERGHIKRDGEDVTITKSTLPGVAALVRFARWIVLPLQRGR